MCVNEQESESNRVHPRRVLVLFTKITLSNNKANPNPNRKSITLSNPKANPNTNC